MPLKVDASFYTFLSNKLCLLTDFKSLESMCYSNYGGIQYLRKQLGVGGWSVNCLCL